MTDKPNAFTAGPTLTWGNGKAKRPDLTPRRNGLVLSNTTSIEERKARGALIESRADVIDRWKRRAGSK